MKCPKCGRENKEGANFCAGCRHNFNEIKKIDRQSPKIKNRNLTLKEESKDQSSHVPIIACLAIIIIGVLMVAVIANNSNVWAPGNSTDDKIPVENSNDDNLKIPQNNSAKVQNSTNGAVKVINESGSANDHSVAEEDNYQSGDNYQYDSIADDSVAENDVYQSNDSINDLENEDELLNDSVTADNLPTKSSNRIDFQDLDFKLTKDKIFDINGKCVINDDGEYYMVIKLLDQNQNQLSDFILAWDNHGVNYNIGKAFDLNHYTYGGDLEDNENAVFVDVYVFDRQIKTYGYDVEEDLDLSDAVYYQRVPVS